MSPPEWENTAARIVTLRTPPIWRIAEFAPEALPASAGATAESTTLATGAKNSAMPTPVIANAPMSDV
jgi:hypothetical protein